MVNPILSLAVASILHYLAYLLPVGLLGLWLRPSRAWGLALFESEGVPSSRLVLGFIVGIVTLALQSGLSVELVRLDYEVVFGLFAVGAAKVIGSRFAARPVAPAATTQITAKTVATGSDTVVTDTVSADSVELPE